MGKDLLEHHGRGTENGISCDLQPGHVDNRPGALNYDLQPGHVDNDGGIVIRPREQSTGL